MINPNVFLKLKVAIKEREIKIKPNKRSLGTLMAETQRKQKVVPTYNHLRNKLN